MAICYTVLKPVDPSLKQAYYVIQTCIRHDLKLKKKNNVNQTILTVAAFYEDPRVIKCARSGNIKSRNLKTLNYQISYHLNPTVKTDSNVRELSGTNSMTK